MYKNIIRISQNKILINQLKLIYNYIKKKKYQERDDLEIIKRVKNIKYLSIYIRQKINKENISLLI